jgi:hypothetical protein
MIKDFQTLEASIKDLRVQCGVKLAKIGAITADVVDITCMARYASIY